MLYKEGYVKLDIPVTTDGHVYKVIIRFNTNSCSGNDLKRELMSRKCHTWSYDFYVILNQHLVDS